MPPNQLPIDRYTLYITKHFLNTHTANRKPAENTIIISHGEKTTSPTAPHTTPQHNNTQPKKQQMSAILDYLSLAVSDTSQDVYREADFAIRRANFQSTNSDRHVYQSFRSMPSFWQLLTFTTTSSASIIWTRIMKKKPNWSLGLHFKVGMFIGFTSALAHGYLLPPYQIRRICNWDDNYYSKIYREVLAARSDKDKWFNALGLKDKEHTVERKLWSVPNFQLSGYPAVITTFPDQTPPIDADPLDENDFLNDIFENAKLYHEIENDKKKGKMPSTAVGKTDVSLPQLNNNINLYMAMNGIERPKYLEQYDAYMESIVVDRPADYLHVRDHEEVLKPKSEKDGLAILPPQFKSPHDLQSVIDARQKLQQESNKTIHEQYMEKVNAAKSNQVWEQ